MDSDSTHTVTVTVEAPGWGSAVAAVETIVERAADAVLGEHLPGFLGPKMRPAEVSVVLTDDARIQVLNRDWRHQDKPTNVLSFPGLDPQELVFLPAGAPVLLGDVVVALETVRREAAARRIDVADHLTHLVAHGIFHLLGQDHENDAEAVRMERLETALLARLGIADPHGSALAGEDVEAGGVGTARP